MRTWRDSGHKHKKNKVSVAERKKLKRLDVKKRCFNCVCYELGMNQKKAMCKECINFSNFKRNLQERQVNV